LGKSEEKVGMKGGDTLLRNKKETQRVRIKLEGREGSKGEVGKKRGAQGYEKRARSSWVLRTTPQKRTETKKRSRQLM